MAEDLDHENSFDFGLSFDADDLVRAPSVLRVDAVVEL